MHNPATLPIISPALQDWLANCESLVEMHKNFVADGGHMQFNLDLLDPEKSYLNPFAQKRLCIAVIRNESFVYYNFHSNLGNKYAGYRLKHNT